MRLLIDAGNTRMKWQLIVQGSIATGGTCLIDSQDWLTELLPFATRIDHIAISTVVAEPKRAVLADRLSRLSKAPVSFFWAESDRGGLVNAYSDPTKMGADRWHAMYAAWHRRPLGFAVVDAGSAITVDYVASSGDHLGGFILAGKQMMLRSLQQDAARIQFQATNATAAEPGRSTAECVEHGLAWLWRGLVCQLKADCQRYGIERILCTGGDAPTLLSTGLVAEHDPDLVLTGLGLIDSEFAAS